MMGMLKCDTVRKEIAEKKLSDRIGAQTGILESLDIIEDRIRAIVREEIELWMAKRMEGGRNE